MVLTLSEVLEIPLDETNRMLDAAGFSPAFRSGGLEGDDAAPVRQALRFLLQRHHPYPAIVVDPGWNAVMANDAYVRLAMRLRGLSPPAAPSGAIVDGPPLVGTNVLLPLFDEQALRPRVRNFDRFAKAMLRHLRAAALEHQRAAQTLAALERLVAVKSERPDDASSILVPLTLEVDGCLLRLFTSMTMLGSSTDAVISTLRLETFFAADEPTDAWLRDSPT